MALWPFVINGATYSESDFTGLNYVTGIPASVESALLALSRKNVGISTGSVASGTGSKSFTVQANLAFKTGDAVLLTGTTLSSVGTVTSYVTSSGVMVVEVTISTGSAGVATVVKLGDSRNDLMSAPLTTDLGGTGSGGGFTRYGSENCNQFGSASGSAGASLWDAMSEVSDEFLALAPREYFPNVDAADSPWFIYGCDLDYTTAPYIPAGYYEQECGSFRIETLGKRSGTSGVITYGQNGFVLLGNGALEFDCLINIVKREVPDGTSDPPVGNTFRAGLRGNRSGRQSNIFSANCLGFELNPVYSGQISAIIGIDDSISRYLLPIYYDPLNSIMRLGIQVSVDGDIIRFLIDGNTVMERTIAKPVFTVSNMMHPAFELARNLQKPTDLATQDYMEIESVRLRKNLSR